MKFTQLVSWIIGILLVLLLIVGIVVSITTNNMCNNECIDRGTRFHELLPNGKLFSLQDMCVCHFKDGTEDKFILGGVN